MLAYILHRSFVVLLALMAVAAAYAQDAGTKLRLGQAFEQAGDHERAATIYLELLAAEPTNVVYFDAAQRSLLALKRYDEAIAVIRKRLASSPADPALRATLGSVCYKAGREKEAMEEWDRVIAIDPGNPQMYRILASVLIENRLLDRAADTYRKARIACNNPTLFTVELAQLLSTTMDYRGASAEYVRWLRQNPAQLGFVQSRMGSFTWKPDGRESAIEVVRAAAEQTGDQRMHELLGWLYIEGKHYPEALEVYRKLDDVGGSQGTSLYAFADRAFKERAYEAAAQAYQEALQRPLPGPRRPAAMYGFALAQKELDALTDTLQTPLTGGMTPASESQLRYRGAIAYFREVIAQFPTSEYAAKSHYQIGTIQFQKHFDLDASLRSFEAAGASLASVPALRYDLALRRGDIFTAQGDSARARAAYASVTTAGDAVPDQSDEAAFRLAELDYFGARFDAAQEQLDALTVNLSAPYANDAIRLQTFLDESRPAGHERRAAFARGEFLVRQRKYGDALAVFRDLTDRSPDTPLADDALLVIGQLEAAMGRPAEAVAAYERLLSTYAATSALVDRARFNVAETYQFGLRDAQKAIRAYEQFLADHPRSVLASVARRRIRELRGDAL